MKKQTNKAENFLPGYLSAITLILVVLGFLVLGPSHILNPMPTHEPYPIESLNQIIPGQTDLRDALTILGKPDSIEDLSYHPTRLFDDIFEHAPEYKVYIFSERQEWDYTELWVKRHGFNQKVVAILRYLPANLLEFADNPSLEDFVVLYGRPDKVLWSSICYFRYLIWLKEGVAVNAGGHLFITENGIRRMLDWNELPVAEVFLFEPMDLKEIIDITKWPWPNNGAGWIPTDEEQSPVNICEHDLDPQDPFDWENLPTPTP